MRPARGALPLQHVKFPESEVGVGWPAVGHRIDLRVVRGNLHVVLSARRQNTKQPCSVLAPFLAVDTLEARCRSDGPPAGPRSIDPLPGSRSFLTVSAVA